MYIRVIVTNYVANNVKSLLVDNWEDCRRNKFRVTPPTYGYNEF